jgi:hypothetical protein
MNEIEIWKPIEQIVLKNGLTINLEGYEVSNMGRVRTYKKKYGRGPRGLNEEPYIINGRKDMHGYTQFLLSDVTKKRRNFRTHLLVMQAFVGVPEKHEIVCHWDDDKDNNKLSNLRYATHKDNAQDKIRNKKRESINS